MDNILEVDGLFQIVALKKFRVTEGVAFDIIPDELLENLSGIDRVLHGPNAVSPGTVGEVERPWYMHTHQKDNLIVLAGERHVDLYSVKHGKVESFVVTPDRIYHNGKLITDEPSMLVWPDGVFHRVSSPEGSASLNLATRVNGYNNDTNFSIYNVNTDTGEYNVVREGHLDQF